MKILNKITLKNIKLNKQRSIVTIVGITLSCALITALLSLVISFQNTLIIESLESGGNRHVTFKDVEYNNLSEIKNHKDVEDYYITTSSTAKVTYDNGEDYIGLIGIDEKGLKSFENLIDKGNIPKNENEVVIDLYYADKFNVKIGDDITLYQGTRYSDGYILNDHNPVIYDEEGNLLETYEVDDIKTYKVVGISNYYTYLSTQYNYNIYTYKQTYNNNDLLSVHTKYYNPADFEKITNEINGTNNIESSNGKYELDFNTEFLRWSGYLGNDKTREFTYILTAIIALIIIGTSVFCIRNSFAISTTEKTKMYGMIASVGATPKQIKKSVLVEGFYLGIIGIPLGIISGIVTALGLVKVINILITEGQSFNFLFSVSIESIILSIMLASITIYFSALGSSRKASKITEIEAIKNQNEIKIKNKKMKCPAIISKIFKVGGVFAYKNMVRNKSKFRTTIISLAVSVAIFISLSYFMQIGFDMTEEIYKKSTFDILVGINSHEFTNEEKYEIFDDIVNLGKIESYSVHETDTFITNISTANERLISGFYEFSDNQTIELTAIGDAEYRRLLELNDLLYEDAFDTGLLLYDTIEIVNSKGEYEKVKYFKDGVNELKLNNFENEYITDIKLINIKEGPIGAENMYSSNPILIVSNEFLNSISEDSYIESLYINTPYIQELHDKIMEYDDETGTNLHIWNMQEYIEMQENMLLLIGIFLYGFIGVIILISLTNIFNTITTNMKLRSKEFAILKSIGMTNKEFKNMIRLESIFYGIKSLFWGLSIGLLLAYVLYYLIVKYEIMGSSEVVAQFNIPWIYISVAIVFVFLVINLIMRVSLSKINKQNIIETIKNENI